MRKLIKIEADNNYFLTCKFEDGTEKKVSLSFLLNLPAFAPLKSVDVFKKIKNKYYFVEWEGYDIDLSAETLWHM